MAMKLKSVLAIILCVAISGCLIPDEYVLTFTIPDKDTATWTYDGLWRVMLPGYDPRVSQLTPRDIQKITGDLNNLAGRQTTNYIGQNVWKQTLDTTAFIHGGLLFPTAQAVNQNGGQTWLVRIIPEEPNSVLLETAFPPNENTLRDLQTFGYTSSGQFRLVTSGKLVQLSGPPLSKAWFSSTYSTAFKIITDPRIVVRITF
jgi:hypothetical protein